MYIHQKKEWPHFDWDSLKLAPLLSVVHRSQGALFAKMETLASDVQQESFFNTLVLDVLKTSEIEGEYLNVDQVRSSIARKLGVKIPNFVDSERDVDGVVEMLLDATQKSQLKLTSKRLFFWHQLLFPQRQNGLFDIVVGQWRDDRNGPMQVISGLYGQQKIHFEAPPAQSIPAMMSDFLEWINSSQQIDPIVFAGIAHFWFVTIHPFDDGNGRIARAITDMLLARADGCENRFYSLSAQIRIERNEYYKVLEHSQKADLDVTLWLEWFIGCVKNSLEVAHEIIDKILKKYRFWNQVAHLVLNARQRQILELLLDDFTGNLTTGKWAKIAKCSEDSALRDIQFLVQNGILSKENAGGRSTHYCLKY